jgi:hypothetical protein
MLTIVLLFVLSLTPALAQEGALTLTQIGRYETGLFDEGATEIAVYDPATQQLFVTNSADGTADVLDLSDPTAPTRTMQLDVSEYGDGVTSVAVYGDMLAAAVPADPAQDPGSIVLFNTAGEFQAVYEVGALPDMVTFTPDGAYIVTALEGEPSDDYTVDPEGMVGIINLATQEVSVARFTDFNADGPRAAEFDPAIRIYGPGANVAEDLEPEYIAISPDSTTAYVTLQENNALAIVDIATAQVTALLSLGFKDYNVEGNGIDPTDEDGGINIRPVPVFGMYQPDGIAAYEVDGALYLVTANEGDSRDYEDVFSEEGEPQEVTLDAEAFPNAEELILEENIGKLEISTVVGDTDGDGDYDALYNFGARSFSIWSAADGSLVWDSGDDFEQITAAAYPEHFNSTSDEGNSFEDRSDNSGPEPEGVTLGEIDGVTYAFVGLERIGGVMVYNVSDPTAPEYVTYINTRDFAGDPTTSTAGDLAPEGLVFISAENSPTGTPLLVVSYEVSGSITIYEIAAGA